MPEFFRRQIGEPKSPMAKSEPKPKKEIVKSTQTLKCLLTEPQLLIYGARLAECSQKLGAIEAEKKRVTDDFKAQTSMAESEIGILSNKISTRSEYREVECSIVLGDPKDGIKTTYRDDTSEQIAIGPMTAEEKQRMLPLDAPAIQGELQKNQVAP